MKIFKSYGFWTAFAGAVVILVNSLGQLFGFSIESKLIENVILAFAGVLVALGVVSMEKAKNEPENESENEGEKIEEQTEEKPQTECENEKANNLKDDEK